MSGSHDDTKRRQFDSNKHHHRSTRLRGYDYAQAGAYFITLCTHDRHCLFGEIVDEEIRLSVLGQIVVEEWMKTAQIRAEIELDEWVVMPNHFHAIVVIVDDVQREGGDAQGEGDRPVAPTDTRGEGGDAQGEGGDAQGEGGDAQGEGDRPVAPTDTRHGGDASLGAVAPTRRPRGPTPKSIGALMAGFKSAVTTRINQMRQTPGMPLWQRNYWDHIIRNEAELNQIREYIRNNPARWESDKLHKE